MGWGGQSGCDHTRLPTYPTNTKPPTYPPTHLPTHPLPSLPPDPIRLPKYFLLSLPAWISGARERHARLVPER